MNFFLAIINVATDLWKWGTTLLLAHWRKHKLNGFYFKQTGTDLLKNTNTNTKIEDRQDNSMIIP